MEFKIHKLFIENFMAHEKSFIDFDKFSSALIVGVINNNNDFSNAAGKSTIFKALEYCFFNKAEVNLNKLIREGADNCSVTIDFSTDKSYRLTRRRNIKNTTEVLLFELHDLNLDIQITENSQYLKPLSGRRDKDTDKEIYNLTKLNYKTFRTINHFVQNDFEGIPSATPEKRRQILKEILNLSIYPKLEKIAKDKFNNIQKEIYALNSIKNNISYNKQEEYSIKQLIPLLSEQIKDLNQEILISKKEYDDLNNIKINISKSISNDIANINSCKLEIENCEKSKSNNLIKIKELSEQIKSNNVEGKLIISEVKDLKNQIVEVSEFKISQLTKDIDLLNEKINQSNFDIKQIILCIEDLKTPMPEDGNCKICRSILTEEYKENCSKQLKESLLLKNKELISVRSENAGYIEKLNAFKKELSNLHFLIKNNESLNNKIHKLNLSAKSKKEIIQVLKNNLKDCELELEEVDKKLNSCNLKLNSLSDVSLIKFEKELEDISSKIEDVKNININKEKKLFELKTSLVINEENLNSLLKAKEKINEIEEKLSSLNSDIKIYPDIISSFSSKGIPSQIINKKLNDIQHESNEFLNILKPEIQIQFITEKEVKKEQEEVLEIMYFINGREREYSQLSGAQKVSVTFALKLGISQILQKSMGVDSRLLLIDEIDQCLDGAGIDAFYNVLRKLQSHYKIMTITHNEKLKNKFNESEVIIVRQDRDGISRASILI